MEKAVLILFFSFFVGPVFGQHHSAVAYDNGDPYRSLQLYKHKHKESVSSSSNTPHMYAYNLWGMTFYEEVKRSNRISSNPQTTEGVYPNDTTGEIHVSSMNSPNSLYTVNWSTEATTANSMGLVAWDYYATIGLANGLKTFGLVRRH